MAFTEFYCDSANGNNVNAGSTTSGTADATTTNGNWDATTGVFIAASGTPFASTNVGDFASVYNDGATVAVFVGRVTTVTSSTQITVSLTAKMGTAPTTSATARSCKIGGCWKGPNSSSGFPLSLIVGTLTNASGDPVRVNYKNNASYSVTSAITGITNTGNINVTHQGYSSTVGDGGRATLTTATNSIGLLTSGINNSYIDMIFSNTASTGSSIMVTATNSGQFFYRCVFTGGRASGVSVASRAILVECEAYDNNRNNTANSAGFQGQQNCHFVRCISHDNTGSNTSGWYFTGSTQTPSLIDCIADTNGNHGFSSAASTATHCYVFKNCEAYGNTGAGISIGTSTTNSVYYIENCNFSKNGTYGIDANSATGQVFATNCGFGGGATYDNDSGQTNGLKTDFNQGPITYTTHPWRDPDNGDFRILSSESLGKGRGTFTQTASSYSGTVGYPQIGAAVLRQGAGILINNGMVR